MKAYSSFLFIAFLFLSQHASARGLQTDMSFVVSMENPASHYYHVVLTCRNVHKKPFNLNMCAWTPGYYEILDYEKALENFSAANQRGKEIHWTKVSKNTWQILNDGEDVITITYDIKAVISFVGNVYLDENRGYITPGGLFLYRDEELQKPVTIQVQPYSKWKNIVATGLDSLPGKTHTFYAANFDVLYDSPFLMGNLDELPSFVIKGVPHYFIGYDLGNFDRQQFMDNLKRIVENGINIIGDIPYTHYTFLGIGRGGGGIEHLNSTSISYGNNNFLSDPEGAKRFYSFLAHEYFHNYNVKRIRPIELGPFDYSKEAVTSLLWVSEGFTDYYDYMMVKGAALVSAEDVLKAFSTHIRAYENKPGHLVQSAVQSSRETWSEPPFGKTAEQENKTISYYDKGCILGLMIDLKIRHETKNKYSLDDVMRALYKDYYQTKKRGFTEQEFQQECEKIAGTSLKAEFEYAATVKEVNYPKYFAYAGLTIDTAYRALPGAYLGIIAKQKDSSLVTTAVEWNSPAWNAGIRVNDTLLTINDAKADKELLLRSVAEKNSGDTIRATVLQNNSVVQVTIKLGVKYEKSFVIKPVDKPDMLQLVIYKSWLRE